MQTRDFITLISDFGKEFIFLKLKSLIASTTPYSQSAKNGQS